MSKILKAKEHSHDLGHIVQTNDGKAYLVDSCYTLDHGYETMVFKYDLEADRVASWTDLYANWYTSRVDMAAHHEKVCASLETYLDEDAGWDE